MKSSKSWSTGSSPRKGDPFFQAGRVVSWISPAFLLLKNTEQNKKTAAKLPFSSGLRFYRPCMIAPSAGFSSASGRSVKPAAAAIASGKRSLCQPHRPQKRKNPNAKAFGFSWWTRKKLIRTLFQRGILGIRTGRPTFIQNHFQRNRLRIIFCVEINGYPVLKDIN